LRERRFFKPVDRRIENLKKMDIVKLKNVAEISAGGSAPQGSNYFGSEGKPFVRAGSLPLLLRGETESSLEHLTEEIAQIHRLRLFPKDTIVFAKSGMSAMKGHIYQLKQSCYLVNHLAAITPKEDLHPTYLRRWFQVFPPSHLVQDSGYPSIRLSDIAEIEIPLPPLAEQKRIAAVLDKADELRRKRLTALRKLDELTRSLFLEMFGDPVTNPKDWKMKTTGELLEFLTSGSRGWAQHYAEKGSLFLRIQNVGKNRLLLNDVAYVDTPNTAESRRTKVQAKDVLISITADLGRCAYIPENLGDAYINQHLALLRLKNIEPEFFSAFIASEGGQRQIRNLNREGVKAGLNFDNIRSIKVFIPPTNLQKAYIDSVSKIEKMKDKFNKSFKESDKLFQSLQQRAFRGDLFAAQDL